MRMVIDYSGQRYVGKEQTEEYCKPIMDMLHEANDIKRFILELDNGGILFLPRKAFETAVIIFINNIKEDLI